MKCFKEDCSEVLSAILLSFYLNVVEFKYFNQQKTINEIWYSLNFTWLISTYLWLRIWWLVSNINCLSNFISTNKKYELSVTRFTWAIKYSDLHAQLNWYEINFLGNFCSIKHIIRNETKLLFYGKNLYNKLLWVSK